MYTKDLVWGKHALAGVCSCIRVNVKLPDCSYIGANFAGAIFGPIYINLIIYL